MPRRSAAIFERPHGPPTMTELEFRSLALQGFNRIPLIAEAFADLETPLSLYLKLARGGIGEGALSFLLESVVGGERFGRYSFIGLPARTLLRASGRSMAAKNGAMRMGGVELVTRFSRFQTHSRRLSTRPRGDSRSR